MTHLRHFASRAILFAVHTHSLALGLNLSGLHLSTGRLLLAVLIFGPLVGCTNVSRQNGPSSAEAYSDASRDDGWDEESGDVVRKLPSCNSDKAAPEFPEESEGAAFRALILLTIGPDGSALDPCYLRAEGPPKYEKKALSLRKTWKYDAAYAGQKREKLITWRVTPPDPEM